MSYFLHPALYVFIISMLPLIELRGAIPVGAALGLEFFINYLISVIGNLLPVPFILLFIPKILDFMARFKLLRPIVTWLRKKANKHSKKVLRESEERETPETKTEDAPEESLSSISPRRRTSAAVFVGLLLFVAIPLPGTGAWTGALVAALFSLPKRSSFLAISLGVAICGVIMCLASYGILGFLSFLL